MTISALSSQDAHFEKNIFVFLHGLCFDLLGELDDRLEMRVMLFFLRGSKR